MTKAEKALRFAAQALGGAMLIGLWIEYSDSVRKGAASFQNMALLFVLSVVILLLLTLLAKRMLRIRGLLALGKMTVCYLTGVGMAMAMAALILLLIELDTAFTSMMMLIRHGGQ